MPRHVRAAVLTIGLLGTPTLAQAELSESPITPGFWSFPTHKTRTAKDVLAACRDRFENRFAAGHFIASAFNYKKPRGVVSSDRSLKSADACLVATSRSKHVR